jgi:hypothetical protein
MQKLPLGPDCTKYLMTPPKAPSNLDHYIVDTRPFIPAFSQEVSQHEETGRRPRSSNRIDIRLAYVVKKFITRIVAPTGNQRAYWMLCASVSSGRSKPSRVRRARIQCMVWLIMSIALFILFGGVVFEVYFTWAGWFAAADFLDTCKIHQVKCH